MNSKDDLDYSVYIVYLPCEWVSEWVFNRVSAWERQTHLESYEADPPWKLWGWPTLKAMRLTHLESYEAGRNVEDEHDSCGGSLDR